MQCKQGFSLSAIVIVDVLTGKSGLVAQRFASSVSSVGIASHFVLASEWIHGDLGKHMDASICWLFMCVYTCVCMIQCNTIHV